MKKIICASLLVFGLTSCSGNTYKLKNIGSIFIFKRDMVTYSIKFKEYTENSLTFYVEIKNNTDKKYPLYIKYSDYLSSVIINNTTVYDTVNYIWYYGDIKYEDYFTMMITLSEEGSKNFNYRCDVDIGDAYIPTGISNPQKSHYIEIILDDYYEK